ncbi:chitosanase [Micromonospora sp. NPDC049240]|uniref:chitosanase n=1 Tax=Micromonospora sp. NPDC049240 TaxID=3155151 RepID=UPI0033D63672
MYRLSPLEWCVGYLDVRRRRPRVSWTALPTVTAAGLVLALLVGAHEPVGVDAEQRLVLSQLESALLHDTAQPQYARAVRQFDSRGYLLGIGDFSTANGEAFEVVQSYAAQVGPTPLSRRYLTVLARLSADQDPSVTDLAGLPAAWAEASADARFRRAQDDVLESRYLAPALSLARTLDIRTQLGVAILFDSMLQHGNTDDVDSLPALVRRATHRAGGPPGTVTEREWLSVLLRERRATLTSPADREHRNTWPYTVGRVDVLAALLYDGHDTLRPPLTVAPYGTPRLVSPTF